MSVSAEGDELPPAMLRAMQPAGAVFALGWVMAELFDPRRRVNVTAQAPPFNPDTQLPLLADLAADPKLVFLAAELSELLRWFPALHRPLRLVTAQTGKKRAAIATENLATAEAAAEADNTAPTDKTAIPDDVLEASAATAAVTAAAFSATQFLDAVTSLHQAVLDEFADDQERLSAYQLGLALSDLVWLPAITASGSESPASRPSALFGLFARPHLATVHTLLNGAGTQLPAGAATIVSRSVDNWATWLDVNSGRIKSPGGDVWSENANVVLSALRVQGWVWQSVLIADPEVSVQPSMGAWVEAASSLARAAGMISETILRRFWWMLVLALVTLGGLLYLVISNLSGLGEVWASLATVAAVLGSATYGVGSGVSSALSGIGYDIWSAAKLDAATWEITWLPALTSTTVERARMERQGVAVPQIRKNLDL
jgi:hypothetical protein